MKYFFSTNIDKNSKSTKSIKKLLEDIINLENKTKPHSDEELCKILKEKNVEISRRTVAKYREDMGIMSSSKRKRYNIT